MSMENIFHTSREMAKNLATKITLFLYGCRNLAKVKSDTPLAFDSTVYGRRYTDTAGNACTSS